MSAVLLCARCGWLEPGPDHDCVLVERREPTSREALLLTIAKLAHERDESVRQVADLRLELKELRGSAAVLAESLGIRVN